MSGRFSVGGAPKSEFAGFAPISDGVVEETCLREMMRQDLGLHGDYFWEVLLQRLSDPRMEFLPLAAQQHAVGSLLDEGVLEHERRAWRRAAAEQKAGPSQLGERVIQVMVGAASDGGDQFVCELSAERGTDLRHFF